MFSLGVLFYAVFNFGKTIYTCRDQYDTFKKNISEVSLYQHDFTSNITYLKPTISLGAVVAGCLTLRVLMVRDLHCFQALPVA